MEDRIRFRQWSPPTRSGRTKLRKADEPSGQVPGAPPTPLKPKTVATTSSRSGGSVLGSELVAKPVSVPSPKATSPSGGVSLTPTQASVHQAGVGAQRSFAQRGGRSGAILTPARVPSGRGRAPGSDGGAIGGGFLDAYAHSWTSLTGMRLRRAIPWLPALTRQAGAEAGKCVGAERVDAPDFSQRRRGLPRPEQAPLLLCRREVQQ